MRHPCVQLKYYTGFPLFQFWFYHFLSQKILMLLAIGRFSGIVPPISLIVWRIFLPTSKCDWLAFCFPWIFSRRSFSSSALFPANGFARQNMFGLMPRLLSKDQHFTQSVNRHNGLILSLDKLVSHLYHEFTKKIVGNTPFKFTVQ
jgi:hypothetical protein